jgi:hypothetical protein
MAAVNSDLPEEIVASVIRTAFYDLKHKTKRLEEFAVNEEELKKADSKKARKNAKKRDRIKLLSKASLGEQSSDLAV